MLEEKYRWKVPLPSKTQKKEKKILKCKSYIDTRNNGYHDAHNSIRSTNPLAEYFNKVFKVDMGELNKEKFLVMVDWATRYSQVEWVRTKKNQKRL